MLDAPLGGVAGGGACVSWVSDVVRGVPLGENGLPREAASCFGAGQDGAYCVGGCQEGGCCGRVAEWVRAPGEGGAPKKGKGMSYGWSDAEGRMLLLWGGKKAIGRTKRGGNSEEGGGASTRAMEAFGGAAIREADLWKGREGIAR